SALRPDEVVHGMRGILAICQEDSGDELGGVLTDLDPVVVEERLRRASAVDARFFLDEVAEVARSADGAGPRHNRRSTLFRENEISRKRHCAVRHGAGLTGS